MKTPIFCVAKIKSKKTQKDISNDNMPNSSINLNENNDEIFKGLPDTSQNKINKVSVQKPYFFVTKISSQTKPTLSFPSQIWNKCEKKVDIYEIIKFIKKEILCSLILYINGIFEIYGIKDKLIPIYDEMIESLDKNFNIKILCSTLENIFTLLSDKNGKKRDLNHNIKLIKEISNEKCPIVNKLLNKTFLEALEHFRRTKYSPEFHGFDYYFFRSIEKLEMEQKDKNYIIYYIDVLNNYEYIFKNSIKNKLLKLLVE